MASDAARTGERDPVDSATVRYGECGQSSIWPLLGVLLVCFVILLLSLPAWVEALR